MLTSQSAQTVKAIPVNAYTQFTPEVDTPVNQGLENPDQGPILLEFIEKSLPK